MFSRTVKYAVTFVVSSCGQAVGNTLYDLGKVVYENRDAIENYFRDKFSREEEDKEAA